MKFLNQQPLGSFENDQSVFIDTSTKTFGVGGKIAVFKDGNITSFRTNIQAAGSLAADYTLTLPSTDGNFGQILSTDGNGNLSFIDGSGTGTVTSVSGTGTVSGISLSGTVTIAGDLTLGGTLAVIPDNFAVQNVKKVLAGPITGADAKPTFRELVATDIPTLNQDTTGSAGSVASANLTGNTLASGITGSSLTSVGTINSGTWNGSIIAGTYGGTGINNGTKTITLGGNLTTSGAFDTTIAVSASTSVILPTSGTLVGSNDSGTVTNTMLAGSIANNKLSNSTISGVVLGSNLNTLTIGSGLTGISYNGSGAVTIAIESTVALRADTHYIGTTSVALNRASANLALTGITSITGGSSTSQSLILQSTTGVGTSDSIVFKVGSNGSTTAMTINTSGYIGIGTSSPTFPLSMNGANPKLLINDNATGVERGSLLFHDSGSAIWELQNRDAGLTFFNRQSGYRTDLYIERTTGNIGFGTSSPSNSLHIKAATNPVIRLEGASDSGYFDYNGTRLQLSAGGNAMYFVTGNSEKMRIDASGNIGVGTTTTGVNDKFRVEGADARIRSRNSTSGTELYMGAMTPNEARLWASTSTDITFGTNNIERMRIDSGGHIQIGSAADAGNALRYFDIYNTNTGASAGSLLRLITSNYAGSGTTSADIVKYKTGGFLINNYETDAAAFTAFNVGASERMRINSSGYVGIGTASPQLKLHVVGPQGAVTSFPTLSGNATAVYENALNCKIALVNSGAAGTSSLIESYASGDAFPRNVITLNSPSSFIGFSTGTGAAFYTERMRIDSSGNVGIGTSSPSTYGKLTVNGNIVLGPPASRNSSNTNAIGIYTTGDPADDTRANISFNTVAGASSSSSYIAFNTNNYGVSGGERMRIDSNGNVGIGTSSQRARLAFDNDTATNGYDANKIRFWDNGTTTFFGIGVSDSTLGYRSDNHVFYTNASSPVERMRINASGAVQMPYQPVLKLNGNNGAYFDFAGGNTLLTGSFYDQQNAVGISWNNSTGVVTVPVSGYYFISYQVYVVTSGYGAGRLGLWKNGSQFQLMQTPSSIDGTVTLTTVIYAAANDYFEIYSDTFDPMRLYMGPAHTTFQIFLQS